MDVLSWLGPPAVPHLARAREKSGMLPLCISVFCMESDAATSPEICGLQARSQSCFVAVLWHARESAAISGCMVVVQAGISSAFIFMSVAFR